ncbi:hypothetical protein BGZ63DRAFT_451650 [Mariannaea sp. PMI_226]|nr:hypothetical protein BGZ63DRAFT_451650 [Mariannaea sp. PMI_226]
MLSTMVSQLTFTILLLSAIASSNPINPALSRRDLPSDDLWGPDGNGAIKPITSLQSPDGLPSPGSVVYQNNGKCDTSKKTGDGNSYIENKYLYCPQQTIVVRGNPVQITADIDCTGLATCATTQTYSVTFSSSVSIGVGLNIIPKLAVLLKSAVKLGAVFSVDHTWTDSITHSGSMTFEPLPGAKGHLVFWPYLEKHADTSYTARSRKH